MPTIKTFALLLLFTATASAQSWRAADRQRQYDRGLYADHVNAWIRTRIPRESAEVRATRAQLIARDTAMRQLRDARRQAAYATRDLIVAEAVLPPDVASMSYPDTTAAIRDYARRIRISANRSKAADRSLRLVIGEIRIRTLSL